MSHDLTVSIGWVYLTLDDITFPEDAPPAEEWVYGRLESIPLF